MKLITPNVVILPQPEGLNGVYKQIEIAGRTCYKSEDKITDDSCKEFVQRMISNGHTAMLEHGTIYLAIPITTHYSDAIGIYNAYPTYCRINESEGFEFKDIFGDPVDCWCVTTNLRFIAEHNLWQDMKELNCEPTKYHEKRITARFTCDRGVSHELVRHRVFSFAQESTRFCNYSKDKFGNELTCIVPDKESWKGQDAYYQMLNCLDEIEKVYMKALEEGITPQIARAILPNALKTEVVMTGFESDWKHFFDLRCAPSAHPDMQVLAKKLKDKFIANKIL